MSVVGEQGTAMTSGNGHDVVPNLGNRIHEPGSEGGHVNGLMSERGVNTDEDWVAQIKAMEEYGVGLEKRHSAMLTQAEQEEAEYHKTKLQLEHKKEEGKRQQHVLMDKLDSVRVKLQLNNSKASRKNFLAKKEELSIEKAKAEEERNRLSKELEESEKRLGLLEEEQAEEKQSWEKELEELRKEMERVQKDAKDAETLALQDEITAVEKHREVTMARIDAWLKEVGQYLNVLKMDPSPPQRHLRQEWEKHESLVRNSRSQLQVTFQEVLQQLRQGNEVESKINVPTLPQTPMVDLIISQMRPHPRPPFLPYQMGPPPPNMQGFMARPPPPFPHQPYPFQPYPHPHQAYPHPTQRYPYPNQPHPHLNQPHPHLNQPHPHLNQPPPHPNQQPQHPNQPHPNQQSQNQPHPHPNQQPHHPNQPHPNLPNQNQPQPNQAHSYQQQQLQQQQPLQFRPQMRVTPPPKLSPSPVQTLHPATPSPTLPSTQTPPQTLHPAPTSTSSSSTVPPASAGKLDKLLEKLGGKFPQYTRAQLMSALQQIKSSRGTMAGLSMDEVIEQVGLKLADKPAPGPISRPTASATAAVRGFSGPPQHSPGPIQRPAHPAQTIHNKAVYTPSPPPSPQQASTTSRKLCLVCQNQVEAESQHPLSCPHIVHRDCISVWLQTSKSQACPFCPCK